MRSKVWAVTMGLALVLCFFAAPNNGFGLLIAETPVTFSYTNPWGLDVDLAEVSIEVYQGSYAGGAYSDQIDVDLGETDFLYVYAIENVDLYTPFSAITAFSIGKTPDSGIDLTMAGSLSGNANFNVYEPNILISGLSIAQSELDVVYFVSDHLPNWLDSYVAGTWAPPHADVLAPNHPVPEPTTLLLLGSGLVVLAGLRKKLLQNRG